MWCRGRAVSKWEAAGRLAWRRHRSQRRCLRERPCCSLTRKDHCQIDGSMKGKHTKQLFSSKTVTEIGRTVRIQEQVLGARQKRITRHGTHTQQSSIAIAECWRLHHTTMRVFKTVTSEGIDGGENTRASSIDSALPPSHLSSCHVHSQTLPLALKPIASIIARWPSSGNNLFLKFSLLPRRFKATYRDQRDGEGSHKRLDLRRG